MYTHTHTRTHTQTHTHIHICTHTIHVHTDTHWKVHTKVLNIKNLPSSSFSLSITVIMVNIFIIIYQQPSKHYNPSYSLPTNSCGLSLSLSLSLFFDSKMTASIGLQMWPSGKPSWCIFITEMNFNSYQRSQKEKPVKLLSNGRHRGVFKTPHIHTNTSSQQAINSYNSWLGITTAWKRWST